MNKVISFATGRFVESQKTLEKKCLDMGIDKVISYNESHIDKNFIKNNYKILKQSRGAGYWLWKPYLINKTLIESDENDVILYCDSGLFPVNDLQYLINLTNTKDIILFQVHEKLNKMWTKKQCFELMNVTEKVYLDSEQVCATYQIYKNTQYSINFVNDLLFFSQNEDIITDNNIDRKKELECFIDHRHDQSILTNLAIKNKIEIFRDPSQYGNDYVKQYKNSNYPQIFNLHRGNI